MSVQCPPSIKKPKRARVPLPSETHSAEEAFQRLNISRTAGYALIAADAFPVRVLRIGRSIRVPIAALDAYIAGS